MVRKNRDEQKNHRGHKSGKENGRGDYKENRREKRVDDLVKHTFLENTIMISNVYMAV